jgi:formylmethanofuran dehydrogenase subunit E
MRTLDELLKESSFIHGHHCAGQVLGVRMAMAGCREVSIEEPKGCKKLMVYVEIDRCATDAVQAVTGCSLGKRTLRFLDYGKMAATFVNLETRGAVRVLARDDARELAALYCPDAANPQEAQKNAYRIMPEQALFSIHGAHVTIPEDDFPGHRGVRASCGSCGEGINFHRTVQQAGRTLCIPCARRSSESERNAAGPNSTSPPVLLIVGYKKVGKTSLLENLVAELSARAYRIGCVKHHHSELSVSVDSPGTDTWRLRRAGAKSVALVAPAHVALFYDAQKITSLDETVASLDASDIILAEGFHLEPRPKIEVVAVDRGERLCAADPNLIAVVGAVAGETALPSFSRDEIVPLADFVERQMLRKQPQGRERRPI